MRSSTRVTCGIGLVLAMLIAAVPTAGRALPIQKCSVQVPEWSPRGSAKTARPRITATITSSCGAAIDASSVRMTVNDEAVIPKTEGAGPQVTAVYTPEAPLLEESDHTITVRAADASGTTGERTWTFHLPNTYLR